MVCDIPVQTYYEYVMPYRDNFGLIAQSPLNDRDGGDTANRIGIFYSGLYLIFKDDEVVVKKIHEDFKRDLKKITVEPGRFIRNPDPNKWYSNPDNFTRDQTTPLVIALGYFNGEEERAHVRGVLDNIFKNNGFYPNRLKNWNNEEKVFPFDYNDPAGPGDYSIFIRSLRAEKYRWYLYFADVFEFVQSIIRVIHSYIDPTSTSDDLNLTIRLLQAKHIWPTFWTNWASFIYYNFRNLSPPTKEMGKATSGVQSAWNFYFREEAHGPPLYRIYQCIIDKEFSEL